MLRRSFVRGLFASLAFSLFGTQRSCTRPSGAYEFAHGVASGDPLHDGVVLWTRVSGAKGEPLTVGWEIAEDSAMQRVVRRGDVSTGDDRDYTVKADVRGLDAGVEYYYRFAVDGSYSPVGRTRTLPGGHIDAASFAVVSCSNYPYGFFHAYRDIAEQEDLLAVIHLGDYIYEYGMGEYATEFAEALGRVPQPAGEVRTLNDYRRRHAQYKADPDSRAMLARHPLIAVWDDHEIANDAWRNGAQNHQADDGDFHVRVDAAVQAYFEWMPIRGQAAGSATRIFRSFECGDLLSLTMLDTRLYGRDRQPDVPASGETLSREAIADSMRDPDRHLLGAQQERWLNDTLGKAETTWQFVGQQVLVAPLRSPDLEPLLDRDRPSMLAPEALDHNIELSKSNPPLLLDTWDGYPPARERFLAILAGSAPNPVVLSGDLHTSMATELTPLGAERPVAAEFMTTSVTSPGFAEYLPERHPGAVRDAVIELNPWVKYMETDRRGWLRMTVDHDECVGEWRLLDTVHERGYTVSTDNRLALRAGEIDKGLINRSNPNG